MPIVIVTRDEALGAVLSALSKITGYDAIAIAEVVNMIYGTLASIRDSVAAIEWLVNHLPNAVRDVKLAFAATLFAFYKDFAVDVEPSNVVIVNPWLAANAPGYM